MIEKVLANGVEIFRVETNAGKLVTVSAAGTVAAVLGESIAFEARRVIMQISGLPVTVMHDAPMTVQFTLDIAVGGLPVGAFDLQVDFTVNDADHPLEAELFVNGKFVDHLWPGGNTRANGVDSLQRIEIPGSYLNEGANLCEVTLIKSGAGFTILGTPAPVLTILTGGSNPAVPPLFMQASDAFDKLSKEL